MSNNRENNQIFEKNEENVEEEKKKMTESEMHLMKRDILLIIVVSGICSVEIYSILLAGDKWVQPVKRDGGVIAMCVRMRNR